MLNSTVKYEPNRTFPVPFLTGEEFNYFLLPNSINFEKKRERQEKKSVQEIIANN
jgi:hypothetical protein